MTEKDSARLQRLLIYLNDGWDAFIENNFPGLYPEDELFNLVTTVINGKLYRVNCRLN